jgi:hypothetical protein
VSESVTQLHAEFPLEAVPRRRAEYRLARIPCCYLLKDADGETVLKLNESSVLIWELCNGELTVGEMVQLLADTYPEAAEDMRKDVFRALDELNEEAVIQIE